MPALPRTLLCSLVCASTLLAVCFGADHDERLTWIQGPNLEVGVLLAGAGRVVVLQQPGGSNVLAAHPELWTVGALPEPTVSTWIDVGGHMTWVSPQSEWWNQQTLVERTNAVWPPDAWGLVVPYTIDDQQPHSLTVSGPASPVTGLRMTKQYAIEGDTLVVTTSAVNSRDTAVTWGLWSNLHPLPDADAFVPLGEGSLEVRHTSWKPATSTTLPYSVSHGLLAFPSVGTERNKVNQAKFYCRNTPAHMAAVGSDWCLVVSPHPVSGNEIAHDQAPIEIFRDVPVTGTGLLELEHHGRHATINPGESLTLHERWRLLPYTGGATIDERAAFVAELLSAQP